MKRLRWLLLFLALTLLPIGFLVGTQWGLQFIVKTINSMSGGVVTVGSATGRLATAYNLSSISIITKGADVDIESFHWSWKPLSLFSGELDVLACATDSLTIKLKTSASEKDGVEEPFDFPKIVVPVALLLRDFSLKDVQILDSEGKLAFQIDNFITSLELYSDRLLVHDFTVDSPDLGLGFHGNISLEKDHKLDFMGNWRLVGYGFHPSKGTFSAGGTIESIDVNVALNDPSDIRVVGVINDLPGNPTWIAALDARNVNIEAWILHCPEIILKTVHGDMSGDFGTYRGLVVAEGYWGVADKLHLRTDIDGDVSGIVFKSLRLDRNDTSAVATNASISWEQLFSWEADLDFSNFVLSMFFPDLDASVSSSFHSIGDVTEEGLEASFALKTMEGRYSNFPWSASGNIGLTGDSISSNDLIIKSDSVGGMALVRNVEFSWADKLSWKADLDLDQFDPGFLHPEIAGQVSGHINSALTWEGDLPVGSLNIADLSGQLRGSELFGAGSIAIDGTSFSSPGLELFLGESRFFVSGTVDESFGLEVSFDSPDLSELADSLGGVLNARGQVMGSKSEPHLDIHLSGKDLLTESLTIGSISGSLTTVLAADGIIDGKFSVTDSLIKDYDFSRANLSIDGTLLNHSAHGEIESSVGDITLDLSGKYDDGWKGALADLSLLTPKYGNWTQLEDAIVEFSSEQVSIEEFCFTNSAPGKNGRACISTKIGRDEKADWSVAADINSFEIKPFSEMDLGLPPLTGGINATLKAVGNRQGVISANTSIDIEEFDTLLHVTDDDFVSVQLRDSTISADLLDQNLALNLSFRSNKGGTLGLVGDIKGIGQFDTPLDENILSGELTLDKYYLSSLAAFTGYGVEPTGWVSSSLGIAGTLAQPEIYGKLEIQEGGLELPYQGISLEDVVIAVDSGESGALVRAQANSGGGNLDIKGYLSQGDDGIEASLKLTGENFLLVNLPEYSFRVTPDANLLINKSRGQIKGRVTVPSGLIAPEELSEAVKVSEDVVYLGEENAHDKKGYPFYLNLDVLLGDKVKVDGYGLKGRLGGKLNVKVTPADFITGRGELDLLDSTFTFYGRSLDIERGRMFFTGGPIDNPGVDIRAQKRVTAETALDDGYTVGVDINGLVRDLQFHLYSDPYMEDTDILSQMVVGHSFASSSQEEGTMLQAAAMTLGLEGSSKLMKGVGNLLLIDDLHLEGSTKDEDVSLVVGKRITEDLYIGYDMNMFSQLGQFRVRYDLSRGFYVETRSSSESTGADLIYTFER